LGKNPKHGGGGAYQKNGSTNASRAKETFAADESSLGSKKKSRRNEKVISQ
jgi:hypothetical protein